MTWTQARVGCFCEKNFFWYFLLRFRNWCSKCWNWIGFAKFFFWFTVIMTVDFWNFSSFPCLDEAPTTSETQDLGMEFRRCVRWKHTCSGTRRVCHRILWHTRCFNVPNCRRVCAQWAKSMFSRFVLFLFFSIHTWFFCWTLLGCVQYKTVWRRHCRRVWRWHHCIRLPRRVCVKYGAEEPVETDDVGEEMETTGQSINK